MFCIRRVKFACKAVSASQLANSDCLTDEMPASLTWDVALTGSSGSVALWSVLKSRRLITNESRSVCIWTLTLYSWERPRLLEYLYLDLYLISQALSLTLVDR